MGFGSVTGKSRLPLVLVFAGALLFAGCQTTEGEDGPSIQLFSADQYNIFWDQGDHLKELAQAEKFDEAAKLYAEQSEYFANDPKKFEPLLRTVADALNRKQASGLEAAIERIKGAGWSNGPENWPEIADRLKNATVAHKTYRSRPLLEDSRFTSPIASRLKLRIAELTKRIRTDAAEQFSRFGHFGDASFFDAYPVRFDSKSFLTANMAAIRARLESATAAELETFAAHYPKNVVADADWRMLGDLYVGASLRESEAGDSPDLENVLEAVSAAREAGFDPAKVPGLKIAFVEVTSKTLLKEGQVEFPAEIIGDLPVEMVKADLDEVLTNVAAVSADYLIVFDVALARARRRVTGRKRMPSKRLAGHRTEPNPEYNMAQNELNQAQFGLQNAQMQSASANSQYCYGVGCLGKALAQIASGVAIAEARGKLDAAMEKLRNTPMTVEIPVYDSYNYDLAKVKGTKRMTVHYYVIDRKKKTYFKSTFDTEEKRTFEVAYSVHAKDTDREKILSNAATDAQVAAWEEAASTVRLSRLVDHYLKRKQESKPLPDLADLRKEMLRDKNTALARYEAMRFDARPLNDPRFESVVVVYNNAGSSLGTGFFVKPDVVLTNWHVIEGTTFVEMKMYNKQETFGKVIAQDIRLDLALVKVQSRGKPVRFYTEKSLEFGKTVDVIGHPKGLEFSITRGVVSAIRRAPNINLGGGNDVLYIQTDAPINPGNSGGPLFLGDRVVGVNTWKKIGAEIGGLNFAVHYSEIIDFLREYLPGYQPTAGG